MRTRTSALSAAALGLATAALTTLGTAGSASAVDPTPTPTAPVPTCDGKPATIVAPEAGGKVDGTAGDDVIVGSAHADTINGLGGDDVVCGLGGADVLNGGAGNDRLLGGLDAHGATTGQVGDILDGGAGDDHLDAGTDPASLNVSPENADRVTFRDGDRVHVNLPAGTVVGQGTDHVVSFDNLAVWDSENSDTIVGDAHRTYVNLSSGEDVVDAGAGDDTVWNTTADYAWGRPTINGGDGNDTIAVVTQRGAVIGAGAGDDVVSTDTQSASAVQLGKGDDRLNTTDSRGEYLKGGTGTDRITIAYRRGDTSATLKVNLDRNTVKRSSLPKTTWASFEKIGVNMRSQVKVVGSDRENRIEVASQGIDARLHGRNDWIRWAQIAAPTLPGRSVPSISTTRRIDGGSGRDKAVAFSQAGVTCVSVEVSRCGTGRTPTGAFNSHVGKPVE